MTIKWNHWLASHGIRAHSKKKRQQKKNQKKMGIALAQDFPVWWADYLERQGPFRHPLGPPANPLKVTMFEVKIDGRKKKN